MVDITLMTSSSPSEALPRLTLISHRVTTLSLDVSSLLRVGDQCIVIIDATREFTQAASLCRMLHATRPTLPMLLLAPVSKFAEVDQSWGISDAVGADAKGEEIEARLRWIVARSQQPSLWSSISQPSIDDDADDNATETPQVIHIGELAMDPSSYTITIHQEPIDLAFKEFELLRFLMEHPGHVFTRLQLLRAVWGVDYYGGTRTIDVHVRRLRAKLGAEYEHLICTVRNVGYRFDKAEQ